MATDFTSRQAILQSVEDFDINRPAVEKKESREGFFFDSRDVEDAVYGEAPETVVYDTSEEFNNAHQEFERARAISSFSHTEGWKVAQTVLDEEARNAMIALNNDDGLDHFKHAKLVQDKNNKKYAADRFRQMVENATSVQKPILRK